MNHVSKTIAKIIAALAFALSLPAMATTQCTSTVTNLFSDGSGTLYIQLASGANASISSTDTNIKNYFALVTLAKVTGSQIIVRYTNSGVNCATDTSSAVAGMYLI